MSEAGSFSEEALALVPRLSGEVEVALNPDGAAEIKIPRPRTRWVRFLCFIFRLGDHKILVLDETGTWALGLVDGQRTFRELAGLLQERGSIDGPSARASMAAFLRRLADERVISFAAEGAPGTAREGF